MHRLFGSLVAVLFGDFMEALRREMRRVVTQPLTKEIKTMGETLEQAVARNAQKVSDAVLAAVAKEVGDVKALIQAGNTTGAIAALDALGDAAASASAAAIDSIDVSASES